MGMLIAFAVGYVVGARGGSEDFDDVVESLKAILSSEEFAALVAALRSHAAHTLTEVAAMLERSGGPRVAPQDLVDRVRVLVSRA